MDICQEPSSSLLSLHSIEDELCYSFGRILRLSGSKDVPQVSKKWKMIFEKNCHQVLGNLLTHKPLEKWFIHWNISPKAIMDSDLDRRERALYFRIRAVVESCLSIVPKDDLRKQNVDMLLENPELVREIFERAEFVNTSVFEKAVLDKEKINCFQLKQGSFQNIPSNLITKWPACKNAKELSLSSERMDSLPSEVALLQNLRTIWIKCEKLVSVPDGLTTLPKLQTLILEVKDADPISERIWNITQLRYLTITAENTVVKIPATIQKLCNLQELRITADTVVFEDASAETFCSKLKVYKWQRGLNKA